ncbi:DUF3949 domain-containing protein [Gracilibacillus caseinilyticus]|uniref:DUF3949 domain-containing protein n=1 Tax=Gracilibacillus caseinilyticus TaxID=2932256 RepID=A0ABY4ERC9_9BACI|nr:DUF3949 domain-containing protein [Gracilibacillus caseinilyticus]UOQ46988.1 DUF3949 domain-containing protein [Gracilibacillus caseinilyticus]
MFDVIIITVALYLFVTIIAVPFQYRYLVGVLEEQQRLNQSTIEYYEKKEFSEQLLHANAQSGFLILANLIAYLILKMKKPVL